MLVIKTTGLEQYAPGGDARVKVLVIGGPGVGKTRWASYFPKPIFADCEGGLASVADRQVPYVSVNTSDEMLDLLTYLKADCQKPQGKRKFDTVVIDTLDAYQRKIKNEWMEKNGEEFFQGWAAWGFLNAKMQTLMTRLLNLDLNVVVAVHYKDKTTKDDDTGREVHQLMLQLQGEAADTTFNDFDLVAWMGTYWEAADGERVQKRGLTFKPTPDKPFLKDRLHVTPTWLPVIFDESDYTNLFKNISERVAELEASATIGEIPSATPEISPFVVAPGDAGSGPLPAQQPREIPLNQLDKPTLVKRVRDAGITTTIDGAPIKGNTLKSELVAALEHHEKTAQEPAKEEPEKTSETPSQQPAPTVESPATEPAKTEAAQVANPRRTRADGPLKQEPEGIVNTATGELITPTATSTPEQKPAITHDEAVQVVEDKLGGKVVEERITPVPQEKPAAPATVTTLSCADCGKEIDPLDDYTKLSKLKFRRPLCGDDYAAAKSKR